MNTYLSIVMAGRNDNYGGDFNTRLKLSIESIAYAASKCDFDIEIIIVEWNPPEDRRYLIDAVSLRRESENVFIKFVRVPPDIHSDLDNSNSIPLFEYHAKNVGIRRADGEFILSTNPDIIYNVELIEYFAKRELNDSCYYRIPRYDVAQEIPTNMTPGQRLQFCSENLHRVKRRDRTHYLTDSFREAALRQVHQIISNLIETTYHTVKSPYTHLSNNKIQDMIRGRKFMTKKKYKRIYEYNLNSSNKIQDCRKYKDLFMSASGDFLLMSSNNWNSINGYPETSTNLHMDAYGVCMAASIGLKQSILQPPLKIYHQEHDRSERDDRATIDFSKVKSDAERLLNNSNSLGNIRNDTNWGLNMYDLDTISLNHN